MTKVLVNITGAQGSRYTTRYGLGGWVQALLSVTAGQALSVYVGGKGLNGSSFNGGGAGGNNYNEVLGGGGASDIRTMAGNLATRLIVAGGGGGGAYDFYSGGGSGGTVINRMHFVILFLYPHINEYRPDRSNHNFS